LGKLGRFRRSKSSGEIRSRAKELALILVIAGAYGVGTIPITQIGHGPLRLASPGAGR